MANDYKLMHPQPAEPLGACPCCGSGAEVWEYVENPGDIVERVVMCSRDGNIGPRDSLMYEGCLLHMPPKDFYRGTGREAVRYWNEYAKALMSLQRTNRWKSAQVLRELRTGPSVRGLTHNAELNGLAPREDNK